MKGYVDPETPRSGLYNTNTFARVTLQAIEEIAGKRGVNSVLLFARLPHLVDNYPPHDREKAFDFADYAGLMKGLEDIYGPRGGRVMALRAGRATFAALLKSYGAMVGVGDLALRLVPLKVKMQIGLNAMAKVFNMVSDQTTSVFDHKNAFWYAVERCPACWGREHVTMPICAAQVGLIQEGLNWASNGREFAVQEVQCIAMGHDRCLFRVEKEPIR